MKIIFYLDRCLSKTTVFIKVNKNFINFYKKLKTTRFNVRRNNLERIYAIFIRINSIIYSLPSRLFIIFLLCPTYKSKGWPSS